MAVRTRRYLRYPVLCSCDPAHPWLQRPQRWPGSMRRSHLVWARSGKRVMITRRDVLSAAAAAFAAAHVSPRALAQPIARTAHILTGFTPGMQDGLARLVAGQMSGYAETIVVETRPGAAGRIAVEAVKSADADGSVMLFAPLGFMMFFPHVYKTLRYEPRDFTPVSTVASTPTLLTVGPKVPGDVRTLADFVAWCRANPKHATYGTPGAGTPLHFLGAMLGRSGG